LSSAGPPTTSQNLHPPVYHQSSIIIMEKFTIVAKDESSSACSSDVVKPKAYRQNHDNPDITKYTIMHYEHSHIF
jgi:hypothetical protein